MEFVQLIGLASWAPLVTSLLVSYVWLGHLCGCTTARQGPFPVLVLAEVGEDELKVVLAGG